MSKVLGSYLLEKFATYQRREANLSLVFICWENPRRSGILLFPDFHRFCWRMKTQNHRYPQLPGMVWNNSRELRVFLFSWHIPDFCDGQRTLSTNENWNLYHQGRRWWILLITNTLNCWASIPLPHTDVASLEKDTSEKERLLAIIRYISKIWDGQKNKAVTIPNYHAILMLRKRWINNCKNETSIVSIVKISSIVTPRKPGLSIQQPTQTYWYLPNARD